MAENFNDIFDALLENGVFNYGETIETEHLLEYFGASVRTDEELECLPIDQLRMALETDRLVIVNIANNVRHRLLNRGRYLQQQKRIFRVALPSENRRFIQDYLDAGARKTKRAQLLLENSPIDPSAEKDNGKSRAALMQLVNERTKKKSEVIK